MLEQNELIEIEALEQKLDETNNKVKVKIPMNYLKFKIEPQLIGDSQIIYYNAKDLSFYNRKPTNPIYKIWLYTHPGSSIYLN